MNTSLRPFAQEVATALGAGWQLEPSDDIHRWPALVRADGAKIWFNRKGYGKDANRIYVHGGWPHNPVTNQVETPYFSEYSENGRSAPQISVNADRGAVAVARDIARKFLPVYQPLFDKMTAEVARQIQHQSDQQSLAERVAPLVGGTVTTNNRRENQSEVRVPYGRAITEVGLNYDGTVELKLRLTFDELRALAAHLPVRVESTENA